MQGIEIAMLHNRDEHRVNIHRGIQLAACHSRQSLLGAFYRHQLDLRITPSQVAFICPAGLDRNFLALQLTRVEHHGGAGPGHNQG